MKTMGVIWVALLLALNVGTLSAAPAAGKEQKPAAAAKSTPGVEAAKTLSTITGVAISPLMGVGAVGVYTYYNASEAERRQLPWYAQPWFWMPALLMVMLVFAKDALGTATPSILKKPFDIIEAMENKVSGLVAAGLFVPLVVKFFPQAPGTDGASLASLGFATIDTGTVLNWAMIPFAIFLFALVWLASHAINILILLSPFSLVDAALKSARLVVLSLLTILALINPVWGAVLSGMIIIVAYLISGWSFRLLICGSAFMWDYFTLRHKRFMPLANANKMFAARKLGKTPIRTYGRLLRGEGGNFVFEYRPWLVLPKRTEAIEPGQHAVGRGLFYSEILRVGNGGETKAIFMLPPRYRNHENDLAHAYGLSVCEIGLLKGFKAAWNWIKGLMGFKARSAETAAC